MDPKEGLSEEELAALEDDDENNEDADDEGVKTDESKDNDDKDDGVDVDNLKKIANDDDPDDEDEPDDKDKGNPDDDKGDDKDKDKSEDDDDSEEEDEPEETPRAVVPQMEVDNERLEAIDTDLEAVKSEKDALGKEFEDGDINVSEYHKKLDDINTKHYELLNEKQKFENNSTFNEDSAKAAWEQDLSIFFNKKENKVFQEDPGLFAALDANVRKIASDEANQSRSSAWVLTEARKAVAKVMNIPDVDSKKIGKDDDVDLDKNRSEKDKPTIKKGPDTLGDVPAEEESEIAENDKFADLDKLIADGNIMEYETRLAAMSQSEQDEFLNAQSSGGVAA